jgi:hypothetical protein
MWTVLADSGVCAGVGGKMVPDRTGTTALVGFEVARDRLVEHSRWAAVSLVVDENFPH